MVRAGQPLACRAPRLVALDSRHGQVVTARSPSRERAARGLGDRHASRGRYHPMRMMTAPCVVPMIGLGCQTVALTLP